MELRGRGRGKVRKCERMGVKGQGGEGLLNYLIFQKIWAEPGNQASYKYNILFESF